MESGVKCIEIIRLPKKYKEMKRLMTSNEEIVNDGILVFILFIVFLSTNDDSNKKKQTKSIGIMPKDKTIIYPKSSFNNTIAERATPTQIRKKAKHTSTTNNILFDLLFINPSLLYVNVSNNLDAKNRTKIGQ